MTLFIMRHGESVSNTKQGFIAGRSDMSELTPIGRVQIIRSAYELRSAGITHIYSSPVARAQETAHIIARSLNLTVQTVDWATELDHGIFEGNYWWEVIHKVPPAWRIKREEYDTPYPGGGESVSMMATRLWKGVDSFISSLATDSKIILVSHQAPIVTMHYLLQHGDPASYSSKQQVAFLKHIHSLRMKNGAYIEATYKGREFSNIDIKNDFEPITERKNNIAFYATGILKSNTELKIHKQETASKNAMFHLSNGSDYLLKVLHAEDPNAVERQAELYDYLHSQNISAPHIVFHDKSKVFYKTDVFIQDFIKGTSQKECLHAHSRSMTPILRQVLKNLQHIHSFKISEVRNFWIPPINGSFKKWNPFMIYNINFTLHHLTELSLSLQAQKRITEALTELKKYTRSKSFELVPIHGDLATDNIILHIDKKDTCSFVRIIDFEWARIGDALWDYAYYWGWLEREHEEVALVWKEMIAKKLTPEQFGILEMYRILFHAWTVRDTLEYKGDALRLSRGEQSRELLKINISKP
ncbi:MAG: histidine phosphatase family protein [bacterium]|nr:histidine phosphatase family protein [bacterium]